MNKQLTKTQLEALQAAVDARPKETKHVAYLLNNVRESTRNVLEDAGYVVYDQGGASKNIWAHWLTPKAYQLLSQK